MKIPDPKALFANEYLTSCFIKNVVKASHVEIGEYTYYDDEDAIHFEKNNILFNYPEFVRLLLEHNLLWVQPIIVSIVCRHIHLL